MRRRALIAISTLVLSELTINAQETALALAGAPPLQGGVPVMIDGRVVGAVGVSGDTPQVDEDIALAGANAIMEALPSSDR